MKKNVQYYKESINKIGKALNEKKLKESTFEEIIAPAKAILQSIDELDLPEIPYNELVGPDSNLELDTTENELNPITGAIKEATKQKRALAEAVGASAAIRGYIIQGGKGDTPEDYEAFKIWCNQNGYADVANNLKKGMFNFKYKELFPKVTAASHINPAAPVTPAPDYKMSAELANLMDICNAGADFIESAADTVAAKYKAIRIKLQKVIAGNSLKNYYLLMGDAGIGKSYIVNECLDRMNKKNVPNITGSVGTSQSAVALFLWQTRNEELVILDDCDTMIAKKVSADVSNMLKGAMDPDKHHVHISPTIQNQANNLLAALSEGAPNKNDALFEKVLGKKNLSEGEEEFDDEIEDEDYTGEGFEDMELDTEETIPSDWDYNARIVFISNLNQDAVNAAILSRCDHYELHLTQEEYMVRLGQIIKSIDCGQKSGLYSEEDVIDAKALLMTTMAAIIEAGNNGVSMFGKPVRLKNGGLEFRLVKDLVEYYIGLVEDYMIDHPNEDKSEAKKKVVAEWVRTAVIPRVSIA